MTVKEGQFNFDDDIEAIRNKAVNKTRHSYLCYRKKEGWLLFIFEKEKKITTGKEKYLVEENAWPVSEDWLLYHNNKIKSWFK